MSTRLDVGSSLALRASAPPSPREALAHRRASVLANSYGNHTECSEGDGWENEVSFYYDGSDPYEQGTPSTEAARPVYPHRQAAEQAEFLRVHSLRPSIWPRNGDINTAVGICMGMQTRRSYQCHIRSPEGTSYVVRQRLLKNSPLNGVQYQEGASIRTVEGAVSPSINEESPSLSLGRRVEDGEGQGICYAGRCDTESKVREMIAMIFFGELNAEGTGGKGIVKNGDTYELSFALESLLMMTATFPQEREMVLREIEALKASKGKTLTLTHPVTGRTYTVKLKDVFFFERQFSLGGFEEILPDCLNGREEARALSIQGDRDLRARGQELLARNPGNQELQAILRLSETPNLLPEVELIIRAYLCRLLEIPLAVHCMVSLDRTGTATSILSALHQCLADGLRVIDQNGRFITEHPKFKELFFQNFVGSLPNTLFSRGQIGYRIGADIVTHPVVLRLFPDRLLKEHYSLKTKFLLFFAGAFAVIKSDEISKSIAHWANGSYWGLRWLAVACLWFISLALTIAVEGILTGIGILTFPIALYRIYKEGVKKWWQGPSSFCPTLGMRFVLNLHKIIPSRLIDRDHPNIKKAKLLYVH